MLGLAGSFARALVAAALVGRLVLVKDAESAQPQRNNAAAGV